MVTLLGLFFILFNVLCLVIFMPDLVGPVRQPLIKRTYHIRCFTLETDLLIGSGMVIL